MLRIEPKPGHQSSSAASFVLLVAVLITRAARGLWDGAHHCHFCRECLSSSCEGKGCAGCFGGDRLHFHCSLPSGLFVVCPALSLELLFEHKHSALPRLRCRREFVQQFSAAGTAFLFKYLFYFYSQVPLGR